MRTTTISGRLGMNAEVKTTKKGISYLQFRMASQEYGDEAPLWVNVTSFNPADVNRAKWFTQGKPINVIGTYKPTAYVSRQGVNTAGLDIVAYSIEWVSNGERQENSTKETQSAPVHTDAKASTPIADEMVVTNGPQNPFVGQNTINNSDGEDDLPF